MFKRIKDWWGGETIAPYYAPDQVPILPEQRRPLVYRCLKAVWLFVCDHWKFLVTTGIAVTATIAAWHGKGLSIFIVNSINGR